MGFVRSVTLTAALIATSLVATTASADSPPRGDGDFRVLVEDQSEADGLGVFGATDDSGQDVLGTRDGGTNAFSSYVTVRSYTSGADYVQTSRQPVSGFATVSLDPYGSVLPVDGGWRAFYQVPATSPGAELLTIESDVVSSAAAGGGLVLTTSVINRNDFPIAIGIRYLLDISAGDDDGPIVSANGTASPLERDISPSASVAFAPSSGGDALDLTSPSRTGDAAPDAIRVAHWSRAFDSAFDLDPDGVDVSSAGGLNDSALLYYFGAGETTAIPLAPGETASVSVQISASGDVQTPSPTPVAPTPSPDATATVSASTTAAPTPTSPAGRALPNTGGAFSDLDGGAGLIALAGVALVLASTALFAWQIRARRQQR